ncbi:MAG: hypothetical protein Q7S22_03950, partial [Candidatus Micrarchaeota archaeon]|nr:hypothetical protein [Candidatus Micrarchaeota archaeon]
GNTFYVENNAVQVKTLVIQPVYSSQMHACGYDTEQTYVELSTPAGITGHINVGESTAFNVQESSTNANVLIKVVVSNIAATYAQQGNPPIVACTASYKKVTLVVTIPSPGSNSGYCTDPDASESQSGILTKATISQVGTITSSKTSSTAINLIATSSTAATDTCYLNGNVASGGQIRERICSVADNNQIRSTTINCPANYACNDGACKIIAYICTDNDGDNRNTASSIRMNQYIGGVLNTTITKNDFCIDGSNVGEYLCTADTSNGYSESKSCPAGCQNNACVASQNFCTDGDGGSNYFIRAAVQIKNPARGFPEATIRTDECIDGRLREYSCDNSNPVDPILTGTILDCPNGKICSNGACVTAEVQPTEEFCTGIQEGNLDPTVKDGVVSGTRPIGGIGEGQLQADTCTANDKVKEFFCRGTTADSITNFCANGTTCQDGACVTNIPIPGNTPFCSDSDNGDDKSIKGTISYGVLNANRNAIQNTTFIDSCTPTGKVLEYYCDGNSKIEHEVDCVSGQTCSDGACVAPQINPRVNPGGATCQDSDDLSIYIKGENIALNANNVLETKSDYCIDQKTITEYYCSNGERRVQQKQCTADYICTDGSCGRINVLQSTKTIEIELNKGWNLFSIPLKDATLTSNCNGFNTRKKWHYDRVIKWINPGKLDAGNGYWFKADNACKITVTGTNYAIDDLKKTALTSGWNQIGSPELPVNMNTLLASCKITHGPWSYNTLAGVYEKATTMVAGKGYFIKLSEDCKLG